MDGAARDATGVPQGANRGQRCAAGAAHWVGDAIPGEVGRRRAAVGAFVRDLGAPDALGHEVRLAVSEALSNAVLHAYPDDPGGRLDAHASTDPATGILTLRVRDYGIAHRARSDSPGMGTGIRIMTAPARTIDLAAPADGGTEVRLTFAVSP